jgi:lactate dehydrogenase-like 2-hydroxyacid dehydrogenase
VDEDALIAALANGQLAAAGLDVYRGEPNNIDKRWFKVPNAVLAPHSASASFETRSKMAAMAAQNMLDVLEGRGSKNIVNPDVLGEKNLP